jgi:hypothetical protein
MPYQLRNDNEAQQIIATYRDRFRNGPIGCWRTHLDQELGDGFDATGLLGNTIEFRSNGTGVLINGTRRDSDATQFRWKATGPCEIVISRELNPTDEQADDCDAVRFDFFMVLGLPHVFLFEPQNWIKENFLWGAVGPLIRVTETIVPMGTDQLGGNSTLALLSFVRGVWVGTVNTDFGTIELVLNGTADGPRPEQIEAVQAFMRRANATIADVRKQLRFPVLWKPIRLAPNSECRVGIQFQHRIFNRQEMLFSGAR